MDAIQMFALETFLERNYFVTDEEGTIASIGCASFSTYLTNSDEESYCFSLYLGDLIGYRKDGSKASPFYGDFILILYYFICNNV